MHREARIANFVLAAFAVISLTLLSLPLSTPVQAVKASLHYVLNPAVYYGAKGTDRLASVPSNVRNMLAADIENRLMREQVQQAAWVRAENESLRTENERLRGMLGLKAPSQRSPLWAHVMERDPSHWYRSLMVDAGADQGVVLNAPVLGRSSGTLVAVGRVVEVRQKSSVVLLLSDELSSVAAYVGSASTETVTTDEGLIQGQGRSRVTMNYLSPEARLEKGRPVYTSPTSATFPPDVLIGSVAKVYPLDPFLTFQSVEVQPAVDASSLQEVMILKAQTAAFVVTKPAPQAVVNP
jgi:rod shape-determining protein MreC